MDTRTDNKLLSSHDAGAILGYTHDYISRLCRQGRMVGVQKGREWYVTQEELDAFKARHEVFLQEKKKELSKKFSQIRKEAEARKREAREIQKTTIEEPVYKIPVQEKLSFSMPKQLIALGALLLFVFAQNVFSGPKDFSTLSYDLSYKDISNSIEEGIQKTIYAQSTVVEPTMNVLASAQYLADGYWELFTIIGQLPEAVYVSLHNIGSGYLTLYSLQGEAGYQSMLQLHTMGATVLRGYELVGESFLFGSVDILHRYSDIFNLNLKEKVDDSLVYPKVYMSNVVGGFEYAKEDAQGGLLGEIKNKILKGFSLISYNISSNTASVQSTLTSVTDTASNLLSSFFEFNLVKKEEKIRAIKLEK
ncbi:MAG: hypothetical protein RLZZ517_469 [Candidatus Parcubacteria bacterium]|jgi:hypothetical protein